jgi:hypothetical protein
MPLYNPPGKDFFDELNDVNIDFPNLTPNAVVGWDGNSSWANIGEQSSWDSVLNNLDEDLTDPKTVTAFFFRIGDMVHVDFDTFLDDITSFGTSGLTVTLPYPSAMHMDFWGGTLHDTNSPDEYYSIKGHLEQGSDIMELWFIDNDKDEPLKNGTPITLSTADRIHFNGWYRRETPGS